MIALIVIHLLGVLVDWWLTKDNLIRAMITGLKPARIVPRDARPASTGMALWLLIPVLAFGVYMVVNTHFR